MSTRGLIEVFNSKNELLARIYVHGDMYPDDGVMCEVVKYLGKRYLVSGIPPDRRFDVVNGMDNLAALITAHLVHWYAKIVRRVSNVKKNDLAAGYVYLYPFNLDIKDTDVRYIYELRPMMDEEKLVYPDGAQKVLDVVRVTAKRYEWWNGTGPTDIFDGPLRDFAKQYCKA
ncbi:MAG: hypothetical protein RXO24_08560 [Acidilobus sp.]